MEKRKLKRTQNKNKKQKNKKQKTKKKQKKLTNSLHGTCAEFVPVQKRSKHANAIGSEKVVSHTVHLNDFPAKLIDIYI